VVGRTYVYIGPGILYMFRYLISIPEALTKIAGVVPAFMRPRKYWLEFKTFSEQIEQWAF